MFPLKDTKTSGNFPIVNTLLVLFTVFVFFNEIFSQNIEAFIYKYALVPAYLLNPESGNLGLLTFVSSIFLHRGFMHLISNMWFLTIFGDNVEGALGHIKYLFFYILGGIAASVLQILFMLGSQIPLLGASGAIAAVLGYYNVKFPHHKISTLVIFFGLIGIYAISARYMLVLWFLTQLINGSASISVDTASTGGVAWWAHIGGFVFGSLIGVLHKPRLRQINSFE